MESKSAKDDDDVFHFVAYVPHAGRLYELDGIEPAPIDHGAIEGSWLSYAAAKVQERVARCARNARTNPVAV